MMVLRQFAMLTYTELKLFRREPEAVFFSLILPVFFLFLIAEVFIPDYPAPGIGINYITPALMVLVIANTAIYSVPQTMVNYRKIKFLKRLKGTPVTPVIILGSLGLADFIVAVLGIVLLAVTAMLVYGAGLAGDSLSFLVGFVLVFLSLAAFFLFIPAVARSPRAATAIGAVLFFPMMFFSGVFVPLEMLPAWIVNYISVVLPVTYAVALMQGLWLGTSLFDLGREVVVLLGVLCLGLIVAARTFRWE